MSKHYDSAPGLLSDKQIIDLCQTVPFETILNNVKRLRKDEIELELAARALQRAMPGVDQLPSVDFETLAIEWAHAEYTRRHRPMIEPFEPGQVRYRQVTLESITEERLREVNKLTPDDYPNLPDHLFFAMLDEQRETARSTAKLVYEQMVAEGLPEPEKIVSYGTSSYGYDVRCAREFKVFTNIHSTIVDPKNFDSNSFVDIEGDYCIIPPNSFALARTMEYIRVPDDVLVVCLGKSTYARCGIIVNVTPLEPGWEGHVTLEFSNTTPLPAKIYAGEGVAQFLFFKGSEPCETTYAARNGKYQGQTGVTLPRT